MSEDIAVREATAPHTNGTDSATKLRVVVLGAWGSFGEYGERDILENAGCEIVVASPTNEDEMIAAAQDADGIIYTGPISRRFMESLTRCKVIARSAIGMDNVEGVEIATERGIVLCNVPDVFVDEVANQTVTLLLACVRHLVPFDTYVRDGSWANRTPRPNDSVPRITGQTLGLVGFGNIGRAVTKRMAGFDVQTIAYDPFLPREVFAAAGARQASLAQVLQDSDFVSIHVPLMPETHHLIGARELRLMKRSAILINTARGPVIDEAALITALQTGAIAGAGLDVTEVEPLPADSPLCTMKNVVLTPHMASVSDWANGERRRRPAQEVVAVLSGLRPRAVWNPKVLDRMQLR